MIRAFAGQIPVFGVCLGHQSITEAFGGRVVRAPRLMHGKTSPIEHDGRGVFAGVSQPVRSRTLSLADRRKRDSLPKELIVTARTAEGEIMGLRHATTRRRGRAVPSRERADAAGPGDDEEFPRVHGGALGNGR